MHFWREAETKYLLELLNKDPRPSFSEITCLFREGFPDRSWTTSMISGRTNRLGMCDPDFHKRKEKGRTASLEIRRDRIHEASFVATRPTFTMVKLDKVDALFDEVIGRECKWPLASGGLCNSPACSDGYCEKHTVVVRRCVTRAVIEG